MFNGLYSLRYLYMYKVHLVTFPIDFLQLIGNQLIQLMVYRATELSSVTSIETLTGSHSLCSLQWVRVIGNLKSTLNATTFTGIRNSVSILELSNSGIQSIGAGTFDGMTKLWLLSLDNNQLTTVDTSIFKDICSNSNISIILYDNPWACDCDLVDFRNVIRENEAVFAGSDIRCASPVSMANSKLKLSEFTCNPVVDQIFSPVFELTTMCYAPLPALISLPVIVKRKLSIIQVRQNGGYEVRANATINTQTWFTWNTRIANGTQPLRSTDLSLCRPTNCFKVANDNVYTVCWLDEWRSAISPFDCVTFYSKAIVGQNWLPASNKEWISTSAGLAMVGVMVCGSIVGTVWMKWLGRMRADRAEAIVADDKAEEVAEYCEIDESIVFKV